MNPLVLIFAGLLLCVDIRLAGFFLVLVGLFALLVSK
jgi:membrane protein implicated in regulation of membrane protease activity